VKYSCHAEGASFGSGLQVIKICQSTKREE
jgi:hypothetical protein